MLTRGVQYHGGMNEGGQSANVQKLVFKSGKKRYTAKARGLRQGPSQFGLERMPIKGFFVAIFTSQMKSQLLLFELPLPDVFTERNGNF